jgi:hypothetical protein
VTYRSASRMSLISDPNTHPPTTNPSSKQTPTTAAGTNNEDRSVSNRKPSLRTTAAECSTANALSIDNKEIRTFSSRYFLRASSMFQTG